MPTMTVIPNVELETLRESQDRALYREGIPMLVGLVDERVGARSRLDATESGRQLVLRMEQYRDGLGPNQRDGDMGFVISVLTAVAYEDFNKGAQA
jgi:hypothetical protein